uniref:Carboxylic ester hydrolase n=1 Tax=Anopheles atroparvus TaxID=41427 RepID=A0A182INH9_ANOAO
MWSSRVTMRSLLSLGVFLMACSGPSLVAVAQQTHSRVCIDDGCLLGFRMADVNNLRFDAFVGIPYAKPPTGKLRFKNPVPVDPWEVEYNATTIKSPCLQRSILLPKNPIVGDEDCLYLNVYRPKDNSTQHLPVMVFIHGGGYFLGSADPRLYGPQRILATERVILVTIQYRLGVFGFLSTGDAAAPGNAGMHDQVLALRWVQRNIGAFGGDPGAVTLFGESAGGASVQLHMMSPLSRGLFHRAILMSGSALAVWSLPVDDPMALARRQAKLVGVSEADELTSAELVDVLQYIDATALAGTASQLRSWFEHPVVIYRPTVDRAGEERFLTDDPRKLWAEGRYQDIPILLGTVPNEGAFNADLVKLLPAVLAVNASSSDLERLKQRYFPKAPAERWVSEENSKEFTRMLSDALIKYPTVQTLLEYIGSPGASCRETTLYSFEFTGRHSFSSIYVPSNASHGVCHQDELMYLFRMFNADLVKLLPAVLAVNASSSDLERLKQRYFPKAPAERWVSEENSKEFTRMLSDALIKYPTVQTLLEYIGSPGASCRETTLYSFEFTGRHSFSSIYVPSNASHGVCHQDELMYLFRMVDLFPDFPEESPEAEMATKWTEFFVNFAVEGSGIR